MPTPTSLEIAASYFGADYFNRMDAVHASLCEKLAAALAEIEKWRELHVIVGPWYGEAGTVNADRERVERVGELRRELIDRRTSR